MRVWVVGCISLCGTAACADFDPPSEPLGEAEFAITTPLAGAICDAQITGGGIVDVENDYLPNVLACEHGGAPLETLKAQAIAARSVLYWTVGTHGEICDSQSCQVFSCGKEPLPIHQQAVDETSGVYLTYNNNLTYGAYLAGDASTAPPACIGGPGEGSITYNEGKTGTDVEQSGLLFVHDPSDASYGQNRGCMSQNGARCLEENNGYDYLAILQFYYGADIELLQAPGDCVLTIEEPGSGAGGGSGSSGPSGSGGSTGSPAGGSPGGAGDGGAPSDSPVGSTGSGEADADAGSSSDLHGVVCTASGPGVPSRPLGAIMLGWLGLGLMARRRSKHAH